MTEALAVQRAQSAVHLVARDPVGMKAAQADLANWLRQKIDSFDPENKALNASIQEAKATNQAPAYSRDTPDLMTAIVWGKDETHAIKIVNEHRRVHRFR